VKQTELEKMELEIRDRFITFENVIEAGGVLLQAYRDPVYEAELYLKFKPPGEADCGYVRVKASYDAVVVEGSVIEVEVDLGDIRSMRIVTLVTIGLLSEDEASTLEKLREQEKRSQLDARDFAMLQRLTKKFGHGGL